VRRAARALALALASAALYAAALPPLGGWPLAWVALAPLCAAAALGPRAALLAGMAFGIAAGALVSPWLPGMLEDYFRAEGPRLWLAAAGIYVLGAGIYFAAFLGWLALALARGPVSPLLVGAAWWIAELLRARVGLGNPWALLGYTQMGWLPAAQIADLAGPHGVGAVLAATGAFAAGWRVPRLRGQRPHLTALTLVLVVAAQLTYGAWRLGGRDEGERTLAVGLVQGAIPRAERFQDAHLSASLERHLALTRELASAGAELVAWPELALDFYLEADAARRTRVLEEARVLGVELLAGGLGASLREGAVVRANSVFLLHEGQLRDHYDKVRLMPFSEMRPFPLLQAEGSDAFAAGAGARVLETESARIGVATCSEAMQPAYVRELARAGAEVLLAPSNDGWFGSRSAARQQLEAVAMRAIETRRYLLRPTASGYTAIFDPAGRVLAEAPYGRPAALRGQVGVRDERPLYVRCGEALAVIPFFALVSDWMHRSTRRSVEWPLEGDRDAA
jgi:apolipoprotein N-acyltransferase